MYDKKFVGLQHARAAVDVVLALANEHSERPIVVAVSDPEGELVAFARLDGAGYLSRSMAQRKAYTAARMGVDSGVFGERMSGVVPSVHDLDDPKLVGFKGGVCITLDGAIIGGIGVSGRSGEEDEELARAAVSEVFG
jgi:glc operon protein GlcG